MLVPYGQCTGVHTDTTWSQKYKGLDIYAWYQMTSYPMFVCFIIHVPAMLNLLPVELYTCIYFSMDSWTCAWKWCVNTICSSVCMLIDFLFTCTCIISIEKIGGLINKHQCNTNSINILYSNNICTCISSLKQNLETYFRDFLMFQSHVYWSNYWYVMICDKFWLLNGDSDVISYLTERGLFFNM